jgi:hypothetical protein
MSVFRAPILNDEPPRSQQHADVAYHSLPARCDRVGPERLTANRNLYEGLCHGVHGLFRVRSMFFASESARNNDPVYLNGALLNYVLPQDLVQTVLDYVDHFELGLTPPRTPVVSAEQQHDALARRTAAHVRYVKWLMAGNRPSNRLPECAAADCHQCHDQFDQTQPHDYAELCAMHRCPQCYPSMWSK